MRPELTGHESISETNPRPFDNPRLGYCLWHLKLRSKSSCSQLIIQKTMQSGLIAHPCMSTWCTKIRLPCYSCGRGLWRFNPVVHVTWQIWSINRMTPDKFCNVCESVPQQAPVGLLIKWSMGLFIFHILIILSYGDSFCVYDPFNSLFFLNFQWTPKSSFSIQTKD